MGGFTQYTGILLGQMRSALTARLQDPNNIYWSAAELNANIVEALRVFNAYTGYWRNRITLTLAPNVNFYNLAQSTGFTITVTDTQLVSSIQSALLEPSTGTSWTGTDQFTYTQVTNAVQAHHNQFLVDTGILTSYLLLNAPSPPVTRIQLPQGVIDVRRAAWLDTPSGKYYPLSREDERTVTGFQYGWNNSPALFPTIYSASTTPPLSIQLSPPPVNVGKLELILVTTGTALNPATGVPLSIPDDFSWAVKWGALASLLSTDGQSRDFERVAYCTQRYSQAVSAANLFPSVLSVLVNGNYLSLDSLTSLDGFLPGWENIATSPSLYTVGTADRNLLAFYPASSVSQTATIDTVINAPVPASDGDYIQTGPEYYSAILDYAHHISCFKMGGVEFSQTMPLYESFLSVCTTLNSRLAAIAGDRNDLDLPGTKESDMTPRIRAAV